MGVEMFATPEEKEGQLLAPQGCCWRCIKG